MKIVTIVGARPQFIKAAPVSRAIAEHNRLTPYPFSLTEVIVHTGQHFDADMSDVFFRELDIPKPGYNLGINSASHGVMTGRMLEKIEEILIKEKPDCVLVYGDTNSTIAGALAAVKLYIPIGHIEAGLRSFNREMPEEINRVTTDHISKFLFCPTKTAINNLKKEGITKGAYLVGDVMYDVFKSRIIGLMPEILQKLKLKPKEYHLLTIHRQENKNAENLETILFALRELKEKIVFPVHPGIWKILKTVKSFKKKDFKNFLFIRPVSYTEMLVLEKNAKKILTDSGGVQKEAYWFKVPCITLRKETEWVETMEAGWNVLVGADRKKIINAVRSFKTDNPRPELYGDGSAAEKIVQHLTAHQIT